MKIFENHSNSFLIFIIKEFGYVSPIYYLRWALGVNNGELLHLFQFKFNDELNKKLIYNCLLKF